MRKTIQIFLVVLLSKIIFQITTEKTELNNVHILKFQHNYISARLKNKQCLES